MPDKSFAIALIIIVGFACYFNALSAEFIWDDFILIAHNPSIKSFKNLSQLFTSELCPTFDYYRPIQSLTYLIDYHLFGLRPWGFHLCSLIIHIVNALLVFFIFKNITRDLFVSLCGSLLFISAPFHTEAVAYISGRADLLLGMFVLLAFLFYIKQRYIISLFFFLLSLLAKEQAMIFPIILIIYDLCFSREVKKKKKYYLLFFLYAALYIALRVTVFNFSQRSILQRKIYFSPEIGFLPRFFTFLKSIIVYLKIIFYPVNLHMERRIDIVRSLFNPYILIFFIVCIVLVYLTAKYKNKKHLILFGILWFITMLIPQSSLIFPFILAEHFLYLPSIGVFLILGILLVELSRKKKEFTVLILGICIVFYSFFTITYNMNWRNIWRFYKWTIKFAPDSHKIHYILGSHYAFEGLFDLALEEYRKAIGIDENFKLLKLNLNQADYFYKNKGNLAIMYHDIGVFLSGKGQMDEAEQSFKKAIEYNPDLIEAYNDLGCLYIKRAEFTKAEDILNAALKIKPDFKKAYYNLGVIYAEKKDSKKAITLWQKAIDIDPQYDLAKEAISKLKNESVKKNK